MTEDDAVGEKKNRVEIYVCMSSRGVAVAVAVAVAAAARIATSQLVTGSSRRQCE